MVNTLTRQSPERSYEASEFPVSAEQAEELQAQFDMPSTSDVSEQTVKPEIRSEQEWIRSVSENSRFIANNLRALKRATQENN